jgi:hypothetical protein
MPASMCVGLSPARQQCCGIFTVSLIHPAVCNYVYVPGQVRPLPLADDARRHVGGRGIYGAPLTSRSPYSLHPPPHHLLPGTPLHSAPPALSPHPIRAILYGADPDPTPAIYHRPLTPTPGRPHDPAAPSGTTYASRNHAKSRKSLKYRLVALSPPINQTHPHPRSSSAASGPPPHEPTSDAAYLAPNPPWVPQRRKRRRICS